MTTKKENELKVSESHDNYIKKELAKIESARSCFLNYVPEKVKIIMDWDTLRLAPGETVQKALRNRKSDILYEVNLKEPYAHRSAFFYCHIEHQKESCYDMSYRVLIYQSGTWELCRAQNPKGSLPLIYSIVIFQGPGKWTAPRNFHEFMDVPPVLKYHVPQFAYDIIDLTTIPDEEIKGYVGLQITFFALKYVHSPNLENIIRERIVPLFRELAKTDGRPEKTTLEYLEDLSYYLFSNRPELDKDSVISAFDHEPENFNMKEVVMTIAEKLRQEGKIEEKIRILSNQLKIKFHEEAEAWITLLEELSAESLQVIEEKILSEEKIENLFPKED